MNPYQGNSKTVAFFDLETNESIVIKGLTIVEGSNGLFVSVPSEKGKDDKYHDKIILPTELRKELTEMAIEKYNEVKTEVF